MIQGHFPSSQYSYHLLSGAISVQKDMAGPLGCFGREEERTTGKATAGREGTVTKASDRYDLILCRVSWT